MIVIKKIFLTFSLLSIVCLSYSQISINGNYSRSALLEMNADSRSDPSSISGVIIPRVEKFNTTDPKKNGLLVYLNNPTPPLPTGEYNGFYYWSTADNSWLPLQSQLGLTKVDNSQFFVSATSLNPIRLTTPSNLATVAFNNLVTNNNSLVSLLGNEIIIKKKGWYFIQISISMEKQTQPMGLRDVLLLQLLKNGSIAYAIPGGVGSSGAPIQAKNAYPGMNDISNTFTVYSPVYLNANDKLTVSLTMSYIDYSLGEDQGVSPGERTLGYYSMTPGTIASLSAKYLGDI